MYNYWKPVIYHVLIQYNTSLSVPEGPVEHNHQSKRGTFVATTPQSKMADAKERKQEIYSHQVGRQLAASRMSVANKYGDDTTSVIH